MEPEPSKVGAAYEEAVCKAVLKAKAARYDAMAAKRKKKRDNDIEKINKERIKLLRQNENSDVTAQVKSRNTVKL